MGEVRENLTIFIAHTSTYLQELESLLSSLETAKNSIESLASWTAENIVSLITSTIELQREFKGLVRAESNRLRVVLTETSAAMLAGVD